MSELFPKELCVGLPKISDQEGNKNPKIYAVFQFSISGWAWFVAEADAFEEDICFFGYVVGLEHEWGYFCLSELESVDINGIKVCRDEGHAPRPLSECLRHYELAKN